MSNDSDLKEPIEVARRELDLKVGVAIPGPTIRQSALPADFYRRIRPGVLGASQFPDSLSDTHGTITKPASW